MERCGLERWHQGNSKMDRGFSVLGPMAHEIPKKEADKYLGKFGFQQNRVI